VNATSAKHAEKGAAGLGKPAGQGKVGTALTG